MKKRYVIILCFIALLLTGCGKKPFIKIGKEYVCEVPGSGSVLVNFFTLTLFDDGTYKYNEGGGSSFIGSGNYEEKDGIITIYTDISDVNGSVTRINKFLIEGNQLKWIEDGSDNFSAVTLSDGTYFYLKCQVEEKFDGTYHSYVHIFPEDSIGIIETTE